MKKIFYALMLSLAVVVGCSEEYDDSALVGRMEQIEKENDALDAALSSLMERIAAAEEAVENLEKAAAAQDYVTSVVASEDGKGVIVSFKTAESIFIPLDLDASQVDGVVVAKVTIGENEAVFEYTDGTTVTLPLYKAQEFALVLDAAHLTVNAGETVKIAYSVTGATENTVVDVLATSAGYVAKVVESNVEVTVPKPFVDGSVLVWADNGDGKTSIKKVTFEENSISVEEVAEVPAEGGSVVIKGVSNVEVTAEVVEGADWLTAAPAAKAEFSFEFTAAANEGEARTAKVALKTAAGTVLYTVEVAQAAGKKAALELRRVWGKYAETADGWIIMGAGNLDRGMAMDDKYIYVSKSTANAPVIKAFDYDGNEALDVNVTGMGSGNEWGDAMTYSVNCVRTIPKSDGGYVLLACNLKQDVSHVLQVWAWPDGVDAAPTCIARYAYDNLANASDHRRFGDRFNVTGTWEDGQLWFPSMQADDHGKTIVFSVKSGVVTGHADKNMGPLYFYRMEPTQSTMKDVFFYGDSEEAFMTGNSVAKFVKKDGTTHATGWINWAVTDDYSSTHGLTFGYNSFEVDGKKYIAYVKVESVNGKKGRLVVIEDGDGTLTGFKTALTNNKVVWEFPIQHESDLNAESLCATGNSLGNCNVVVVDGVTYIGAHVQGLGCSLFRFE